MATVEIEGLQRLIQKMEKLGRGTDEIIDASLEKSAYAIKREIEKNIQNVSVPYNGNVYTATDTGRFLRSIHVEKLGRCSYAIGTNVEYAPMIEFGTGSAGDPTVAHTSRPRWVYYNPILGEYRTAYPQPARPTFRPAFEAKKNIVKLNLTRDIIRAAGGMING